MPDFHVVSSYVPSGDQPEAIDALADGLERPQAGEVRWEGSEVRVTLRPHQAVTLRLRAGK